jgi:GNAT superfamily N-acetyltransferase
MGLDNPTDRTFVVEDTQKDNKIVAWSRWMVPQDDGNLERKWPELNPDEYDMDVLGAFFGGMEENRLELMGQRPHWCEYKLRCRIERAIKGTVLVLEMLATHEDYQRRGIAASLIKWGTDQADKQGMETYLDGSEKGQPYYKRWHKFKYGKDITIPDRYDYPFFNLCA